MTFCKPAAFAINTGKVLYSKVDGIHAYYPFNGAIVNIQYQPNSYIKHILHEPSGRLTWIEADNTFHHGKLELNQIRNQHSRAISQTLGSTCFIAYKGFYLLGLTEGILSLDADGNEHAILQEEGNLESLSNNRINCLFVDKTNNLWVGTQLGGINLHNPNRHKFELISHLVNSNFSKCKEILSIAETKDRQILFQNALEGIALFDPTERKIIRWVQTGVIGNCIVPEDNQDNFLVGTPEGLYRFKLAGSQFEFISTKNKVKNFEGDIKSIVPIGNNQYWMAGKDGMFLFDTKKGETLNYFGISNSNLGSENIRSLNAFMFLPLQVYI